MWQGARRLWGLHGQSDQAVADVMYNKRNQQNRRDQRFPSSSFASYRRNFRGAKTRG